MENKRFVSRMFFVFLIVSLVGVIFSSNSYGRYTYAIKHADFSNIDSSIAYETKCCIKTRSYDTGTTIEVKSKGKITVSDEDTEIVSISPNGYLRFSQKTFGNKRSIDIESDSNGNLSYEYREGRKEIPFEPDGKRWLADVLLDVIRTSGIDSDGRVKRIYAKHGINGVISEIKEISRSSVMKRYFEATLDNITLNTHETELVCEKITILIASNTDRATLYRKYQDNFMQNNTLTCTYFNCVSKLSSNTERGSILRSIKKDIDFTDNDVIEAYFNSLNKLSSSTEAGSTIRHLVKNQDINDKAMIAMLRCIRRITSNTEIGSLMRNLRKVNFNNTDIVTTYFEVVNTMTSNTEAGSVLKELLREEDMNNITMAELLRTVKKLTSNTEIGSILRQIKKIDFNDDEIRIAYFATVNTMTSNTEEGSVLRYTLRTHEMNKAAFKDFYFAAKRLSSDTELSLVLRSSISQLPNDRDLLNAFFLGVSSISSNTEHGRVLREFLDKSNLTEDMIIRTLESTKKNCI